MELARSFSQVCPQISGVEAHLRELLEQGFEVAVVKDATAAAQVPEGDGLPSCVNEFSISRQCALDNGGSQ